MFRRTRCPRCSEPIRTEAQICRHCGAELLGGEEHGPPRSTIRVVVSRVVFAVSTAGAVVFFWSVLAPYESWSNLVGGVIVGVFWTAFIHLPVGVLIVAFHPVWSGLPLIVTLLGCGWTVKGTVYFCFPSFGLRKLAIVSLDRAWMFVVPGVLFVILGAVVSYSVVQG